MSDMAVTSPVNISSAAYAATVQTPKAENTAPAPKTDVIDLSKPPTAEQTERLRSAGILGYGSVSASKSVTVAARPEGGSVTHFTVDYQSEYFDLVNGATVRTASTGIGVFTSGGSSAYASSTSQLVQSWKDGSWVKTDLQQAAYRFRMGGMPSWYVPAHKNEDGSFSLAQFGPSSTTTVSGYRASLTITQSGGGQTQVSRFETSLHHAVTILPDQERPDGAVDYRNENFDRVLTGELLERIDKLAQTLYRFDTQA